MGLDVIEKTSTKKLDIIGLQFQTYVNAMEFLANCLCKESENEYMDENDQFPNTKLYHRLEPCQQTTIGL
jgi:hypothetical protein